MRNFGSIHYGSITLQQFALWKNNNARYFDQFLPKLRSKFERKGYGNKKDVINKYISMLISSGGNESVSRSASEGRGGYKAPSSSAYKAKFREYRNAGKETTAALTATVDYFFAEGTSAVDYSQPSSLSMEEIVARLGPTAGSSGPSGPSVRDRLLARRGKRRSERQDRVASGETFVGRGDAQEVALASEEESFFSRYRVPIVIGSALALSGGAYYFFVMRK
jgi:hypothetical protein